MDLLELRQLATATLHINDTGEYTHPARHRYPHQSNWDSALIALGWAKLDPDRAYLELETLLGARDNLGLVPHIAFDHGASGDLPGPQWWGRRVSVDGRLISAITQPPLLATVLRLLYEEHPQPERVRKMLAPLHAWHSFLLTERGHLGDKEPVIIHPWETVRDSAAEWDAPLQGTTTEASRANTAPTSTRQHRDALLLLVHAGKGVSWQQFWLANSGSFRVLDPGFAAILAASCADLAALAEELQEEQLAVEAEMLAFGVSQAVQARANSEGIIRAYDLNTDTELEPLGAGTALTLLLPSLPRKSVLQLRHLVLEGDLSSPFGVRSLSANDPAYSLLHPWRGPVWGHITWLCALGLERHGESFAADLLRRRFLTATVGSEMMEYMHPETGAPLDVRGVCAWTAALTLREL